MLVRSASRRIKMQMRPWAVLISLALGVLRAQSGPIVPSSMPYTVSTSALLARGFSFDKTPRKMCPISGPDGPCQIEAFIGGEKTEDPERYPCRKLDRATYVGRCINGKLEGLSVVLAEGSAKSGAATVASSLASLESGIAPPLAMVVSNLSKSGAARFSENRSCEA